MSWTPDPFYHRVPDPEMWETPRRLNRRELRDDGGVALPRPRGIDDEMEDER